MTITIEIPDSIVRGLKLPEAEAPSRLRQELAIALYAQGMLSFGKSAEFSGEGRLIFGELLARRNIPRHYSGEELADDNNFANGQ